MRDKLAKLNIGCLLHDIGKVVYRTGDGRNHSTSGYDFLITETGIEDEEILNCVRFHHKKALKNANVTVNDNSYIAYIADNIAAASDRRDNDSDDYGFEQSLPLESVFNILNGNDQKYTYSPEMLNIEKGINYPIEEAKKFDESFYKDVMFKIKENVKQRDLNEEYINSLLEVMEATCVYVPSSTNKNELADISLYDHVKMTAAIGVCIYHYLEENGLNNYKEILFEKEKEFFDKKAFCLLSMDISGIQDFIYTITSKDALKTLRSRSFYLEIMMEHIIDELCEKLEITRTNEIYVGGGHCYLIVPNTEKTKGIIDEYEVQTNKWLKEKFDNSLYLGVAYVECNANQLKNVPEGSYSDLYKELANILGTKKTHRYSADDIRLFNMKTYDNYERECSVCKRIGNVNKDGECTYCSSIKRMSKDILYAKFFAVTLDSKEGYLELPGNKYLMACDKEEKLINLIKEDENFVRSYSINRMYNGRKISQNMWVGNYTEGATFEKLANSSEGIKRIAVYRADVDNLGTAFVSGFKQKNGKYETISRTATLSRHLSLFFKQHINRILSEPVYRLGKIKPEKRNITVVYSGGDDIFVVGAWNEVIEFSIDLKNWFYKYTQGMLSISGGIGLYKSGYPVSVMAKEVESLEDAAKNTDNKNAISLFENDIKFKWSRFEDKVLGEKYNTIKKFFESTDDYGKNFLYNLLELVRNINDKDKEEKKNELHGTQINFARYVYVLSRMEPKDKDNEEAMNNYRSFSEKMYKWIKDDEDRKDVIAAIYLYVYISRQEDEQNDN